MRHLLTALALTALLATPTLDATAATKKKPNAAHKRMKDCNAQAKAKALKGADRKAFMSRCLKAPGKTKKLNAGQQRMKDCNAQAKAKGLKGADRKAFMKTCLKKK